MKIWLSILMLIISSSALATIDVLQFKNEEQEQQFRQITLELRCPQCQNNSIADSNSMIATDLRQKVYELLQAGKTKKEIINYMVDRYGNFVTYDPPLTPLTILLWVVPAFAICLGGWIIYSRSRKTIQIEPENFSNEELAINSTSKSAGIQVYLLGIIVALVVSGLSYYQTGSYAKVKNWNQASKEAPALLKRALEPNAEPLTEAEMTNLLLGMRTQLQKNPQDVDGWIMLARISVAMGNLSDAIEAYARAYRLAPENKEVMLGYAEVLTRSNNPQQNRLGSNLLRILIKIDHTNIRVLSAFAFNAFEQKRFVEAMGAWQVMLKLLPVDDERRELIKRSIELAKQELVQQESTTKSK